MFTTQVYIALSILIIVALTTIFILRRRQAPQSLSPLSSLAFGFVLAGIFMSEERFLAYGLMGIGIILAVVDMLQQRKGKKPKNLSH